MSILQTFQKLPDTTLDQEERTFSYKQALESCGFGRFQWLVFWVTSAVWVADAVEVMLLSFLIPELKDEWDLSDWQSGAVGAAVFLGMMFGAYGFANASDRFGRRPSLITALTICTIFSSLTATGPSIGWVIVFRTIVGFGVGGASVAFVLFTELAPQTNRATALLLQQFFWSIGTMMSVFFAWAMLPCCGWRYFVLLCSAPLWLLLLFFSYIPESPRFLLAKGDVVGAMEALQKIADKNGRKLPPGSLLPPKRSKSHGKVEKLFLPYYSLTSSLLLFAFFATTFCYYGICFLSVSTFEKDEDDSEFDTEYWKVLITTVAEFPGTIAGMFLLDRIGRRGTMAVCWSLYSFCGMILSFGHFRNGDWGTICLIFIARASISLSFLTIFIYYSEFYPTPIRNTAIGFASSLGRIAAMTVTFGVETLSADMSYQVLTGVACLACLSVFILPYDTLDIDQTDILIGDSEEFSEKSAILTSISTKPL